MGAVREPVRPAGTRRPPGRDADANRRPSADDAAQPTTPPAHREGAAQPEPTTPEARRSRCHPRRRTLRRRQEPPRSRPRCRPPCSAAAAQAAPGAGEARCRGRGPAGARRGRRLLARAHHGRAAPRPGRARGSARTSTAIAVAPAAACSHRATAKRLASGRAPAPAPPHPARRTPPRLARPAPPRPAPLRPAPADQAPSGRPLRRAQAPLTPGRRRDRAAGTPDPRPPGRHSTGARRRRRPRRGGRRGGGEPGRRRRAVGGRRWVSALAGWADGLTSLGRLTGLLASDLLLVQVLLMARIPRPGAGVRAGPAGPAAPARRLHLVQPDARPHRADHLGLRRGRARARRRRRCGTLTVDYPGMLLAVAGTVVPGHGRRHQRAGRPRAGCATSRGTCCTSTPTSASGSPCRTSCGPARSSSPRRPPPSSGGGCGRPRPARCSSGGSGCRCGAARATGCGSPPGRARGRRRRVGLHDRPPRWTGCRAEAGQFLIWRFLAGPGWTRGHPYSLSAAPDGRSLRITVKDARRRQRARCAHLRPGTRVLVEGPYGRLTERARTRAQVALIGAGVGITPLRALAEELPTTRPGDAVLLHRFTATAAVRRRARRPRRASAAWRCCWLPGHRRAPGSWLGDGVGAADDLTALRCLGARHRRARRLRLRPARAGPTAVRAHASRPPACPPTASTSRASDGDRVKRIVLLVHEHRRPWSRCCSATTPPRRAARAGERHGRRRTRRHPAPGRTARVVRLEQRGRRRSTVTGAVAADPVGPGPGPAHRRGGKITDVDVVAVPRRQRQGPGRSTPRRCRSWCRRRSTPRAPTSTWSAAPRSPASGYVQSLQSALDQAGL